MQNHPDDDEMKNEKSRVGSVYSSASCGSRISEADSVVTTINFKGSSMKLNCNPLKLIQFLTMELKTKLKDFVPDGDTLSLVESS